jgi:hypothetical protein
MEKLEVEKTPRSLGKLNQNSGFATPRAASRAIRLRHVIGGGDFAGVAANETLAAPIRKNARVCEKRRDGVEASASSRAQSADDTRARQARTRCATEAPLGAHGPTRTLVRGSPRAPATRASSIAGVSFTGSDTRERVIFRLRNRPGTPRGTRSRSRETGTRARPSL